MRSALAASAALAALATLATLTAVGCADPASEDAAASSNDLVGTDGANAPHAQRECVIDTISVQKGLLKDFQAAVGAEYTHDYGSSAYPHVEIPGVFDAAISPTAEFGEWFYTIVGFDHQLETLPSGQPGTRMAAVLQARPIDDPTLATAAHRYDAAKAIFNAMTRATETVKEHHAAPHTFDESWKIVRRESAGGRVVCEAETYPDTGETRPIITCSFNGVDHTSVQIFSTKDTSGRCLAE
jgi:hypothetical protein